MDEEAPAESAPVGAPPEAPAPPAGVGNGRGHVGATASREVAVFWDCHYGRDSRPGLGWTYVCTSGDYSCTSFYVGGSWSEYTCNF